MLGVIARKNFQAQPTFKEMGSGAWAPGAASPPKNLPPEVLAYLKHESRKAIDEPAFREVLEKQYLGFSMPTTRAFAM